MEDQQPIFESTDRRHPVILEPLDLVKVFWFGLQFPDFRGLVANFATGLIGLGTRRLVIVQFHLSISLTHWGLIRRK